MCVRRGREISLDAYYDGGPCFNDMQVVYRMHVTLRLLSFTVSLM